MDHWPAGSHLVLETTLDDVPMVAMGYKYNKKKVIHFIFTKGASHTLPGTPYEARWKDDNNNTRCMNVSRPEVASTYFDASNVVDVGNQSRQHDLRRFHMHRNHRHYDISLEQFASLVASDMLANEHSSNPVVTETFLLLSPHQIPQQIHVENTGAIEMSTLGQSSDNNLQLLKDI